MHGGAGQDGGGLSIAGPLPPPGVGRGGCRPHPVGSKENHRRYRIRRSRSSAAGYSPEVMELLNPLFEARAEYLEAAFATVEETWGGVDAYLEQGLAVTPEMRARLRERLLD